jgi:chemotaxis protein methyltransferase CheR
VTSARGLRAARSSASVTEISDDEFALFQTLICREAGIYLGPTKKPMLVSRLMRRVNALKLPSFGEYYRYVLRGGPAGQKNDEMVRLLDAISTNETWFFRNPKHFSFVKETLCPAWIKEAAANRRPRQVSIWSAAASSGEEPFSLAMVLLDALPGWDLRVVATDLSSRVLERARAATWSIEKSGDIPAGYLKRFMLRGTGAQVGSMRARQELRNVVTFDRLNLNDEAWPFGPAERFDAVFCRNVLMYFEPRCRERVLRRILERLPPRGYLFLGDAEGLSGFEGLRMVAPSVHTFKANLPEAQPVAGASGGKAAS